MNGCSQSMWESRTLKNTGLPADRGLDSDFWCCHFFGPDNKWKSRIWSFQFLIFKKWNSASCPKITLTKKKTHLQSNLYLKLDKMSLVVNCSFLSLSSLNISLSESFVQYNFLTHSSDLEVIVLHLHGVTWTLIYQGFGDKKKL